MTDLPDKTSLAATAEKIFHFMTLEHSGYSDQMSAAVDANPASWGLNINDWEWNPGVGVTAISDYYDASQKPEVLEFLVQWVHKNRHLAQKYQHVNKMTPFAIFPDMYRRTGDRYYLDTAVDYADWIIKNLVRTKTGAFQHGGNLTEEIWADTIFMVVLFLARLGRLTGSQAYADEGARQLLLHIQYLQDPETGVLFHGYFCDEQSHKSSARWTRGNAWITLATPMILAEVRELVAVPPELTERYRRMVAGLAQYQAANGLWSTVMDRPAFYQETSGSAGIAAGMLKSVHQGLIDDSYLPVVEKAIGGVLQMLTPEGMVTSVSGGTPIMQTIDEYNQLTRYPTLYGQGLSLFLLSEYIYR
jgi:unsaturated rhamnogalacturonyl hydrolase